jgi:hypothetical protein
VDIVPVEEVSLKVHPSKEERGVKDLVPSNVILFPDQTVVMGLILV